MRKWTLIEQNFNIPSLSFKMNKKNDKEVIFLQLTENGQPATNIIITSHFSFTCFGKLINDISVFKYCNEGTSTAVDMAHLCLLSCILYRYAPSALLLTLGRQPKQLPTACLQRAPLLTLACVILQANYSTDWLKWIRNTALSDMHWIKMHL